MAQGVLAGAPAGWPGCAWEAADLEAEQGRPRAAREVRRVGALAHWYSIREGLGLPTSPMAAGAVAVVEDGSAPGVVAALPISVVAAAAVAQA